ncbi:hypothetical protein HYV44_02070 [Candidatus Microgenomates bacterium]|nr:hypothetical protein [Candidatus Microgenomates bacterium]
MNNPIEVNEQDKSLFAFCPLVALAGQKATSNHRAQIVCGAIIFLFLAGFAWVLVDGIRNTTINPKKAILSTCFATKERIIVENDVVLTISQCRDGQELVQKTSLRQWLNKEVPRYFNPTFPLEIKGVEDGLMPEKPLQTPLPKTKKGDRIGVIPHRKGWPGWRQTMVRYAHNLGGKDFVLTLTAENPQWNIKAVGENSNGTTDHGLCQLNSAYHAAFIKSPSFKYWDRQLEYCAKVWHDAKNRGRLRTTFYGYNRIDKFVDAYDWSPKKRKG